MKLTKEYLKQVILEEAQDVINRTSPTPKQHLINLLDECENALWDAAQKEKQEKNMELWEYYETLSNRCLKAAQYLEKLR